MVNTTNGSLARAAASHLRGCGDIVPSSRGGPADNLSQSKKLTEWAEGQGCLKEYCPPPNVAFSGGAEHEVFFHKGERRVFKRTRKGTFGSIRTELGVRKTASPYFYLCRLEWTNELFGSDLRLEAIIPGDFPAILISQPWIFPLNPSSPLPSVLDVKEFMAHMKFEAVEGSEYTEWHREGDAFHVCDARVDNFIKSADGAIPIDLIVSKIPDFDPLYWCR